MNPRITYIALLSLLAGTSIAQQSQSLSHYRSQVLQYNPEVRAAEKNIRLNQELETSARADYKPKLSATADFSYTGNPMELTRRLPTLSQPLHFQGSRYRYGAALTLEQPLYTGGYLQQTLQKTRQETNLAANQLQAVQADIRYQADCRYWTAVAASETDGVARQYRQSVGRLTQVVRERVEEELSDPTDLLMAEVKLNEAHYYALQAATNRQVARMTMNAFAGWDETALLPVDTLLPPVSESPRPEAVQTPDRPEIRMAQDQITLQQTGLKLNDSRYKPQFAVGLDGSYSSPGYNFSPDPNPNYALYARFTVPLFEWGKRKNEKRASQYRVEMAKENYRRVSDDLQLELRTARYTYQQAVQQATLAQNSLAKARENENKTFERYREGKISVTEVLDAQIYHQTARMNDIRARLSVCISWARYVRAAGINPD